MMRFKTLPCLLACLSLFIALAAWGQEETEAPASDPAPAADPAQEGGGSADPSMSARDEVYGDKGREFFIGASASYIMGKMKVLETDGKKRKTVNQLLNPGGGFSIVFEYTPLSFMAIGLKPEFLFFDSEKPGDKQTTDRKAYLFNVNPALRFLYPLSDIKPYLRFGAGYTAILPSDPDEKNKKLASTLHGYNIQPALGIMLRGKHYGLHLDLAYQYTAWKQSGKRLDSMVFIGSVGAEGIF